MPRPKAARHPFVSRAIHQSGYHLLHLPFSDLVESAAASPRAVQFPNANRTDFLRDPHNSSLDLCCRHG
jgi:hypothetical protein